MGEYKRNPNTKCRICNTPIYRRPAEIERNRGRVYCGQRCFGISCRKEKPCVICGVPMLSSLHKKTCNRACANKNRRGIQYKINRPRDKVRDQRSIKIRLLKSKDGRCERCNYDKYEVLHIHHKNRNNKDNRLRNLELLCPNCHAEEHHLKNSWLNDNITD